jgi:hypothetical protein
MTAVRPCGISVARVGVARLHRHLRQPPPSALVAFELVTDGWPVGWALVGRPASAVLQAQGWVEVTRVAVPSPQDGGPRNGCSALYGAAARWARRAGFPLHTYTRIDEPGVSLRAAGWVPVARSRAGRGWAGPARPNAADQDGRVQRIRWTPRWAFVGPEIPAEWVGVAMRRAA